ncbi:tyrosinase family oxidase copper chaperone [Streptomyces pacificus]|uniref:tyrosinase family oxidase copper chaperone n=1 Tax=Streptomyces pacificus TaxID=2705029 RepID=UPI0020B10DED|nr:tyrosinase family oxidase copper chaperone [Streptomyces pacificus]
MYTGDPAVRATIVYPHLRGRGPRRTRPSPRAAPPLRIGGEELHAGRHADGTWISVIGRHEPAGRPRAPARAAVTELRAPPPSFRSSSAEPERSGPERAPAPDPPAGDRPRHRPVRGFRSPAALPRCSCSWSCLVPGSGRPQRRTAAAGGKRTGAVRDGGPFATAHFAAIRGGACRRTGDGLSPRLRRPRCGTRPSDRPGSARSRRSRCCRAPG